MRTPRTSLRPLAIGISCAAVVAAGAAAMAPTASAATSPHLYPGSVPGFVATATDAGPTAADDSVEGEVYLPLRDPVGARTLAAAVSTPGNARYGQFLSPAQWIKTYSPTTATFNQTRDYLTDSGLSIFATPKSRQYIVFRGPASAVSAAFATTLHTYSVRGQKVSAPARAAALPAAIAKNVSGVSLGDARSAFTRPAHVEQPGTAVPVGSLSRAAAAPACSTYFGQNSATLPEAYGRTSFPTRICGYQPQQLRSSSGLTKLINSGYDGHGQTIGIVDAYASPTIVQDTNDYMRSVGSPLLTTYSELKADNPVDFDLCGGSAGWQTEQTIDVQSAHSIAPGANILYSGGFNCGGGIDIALSRILDGGLATIVSNSYGYQGEDLPSDQISGEQNQFLQAAVEGIGLYFSSGDDGDTAAITGTPQPSFSASSPWVTAVGGTSLAVQQNGSYGFETGWGTALDPVSGTSYTEPLPGDFVGGAGGGTSSQFDQPAYQRGVVPPSLAAGPDGTPSRVVPDVADLADPYTGFEIQYRPILDDQTQETGDLTQATYGGTSLASPIVAAKVALLSQLTGTRSGFLNPVLYAPVTQHPGTVHDVTPPTAPVGLASHSSVSGRDALITLDRDTSLRTAKGYDDVTGVGSLDVAALRQLVAGG